MMENAGNNSGVRDFVGHILGTVLSVLLLSVAG